MHTFEHEGVKITVRPQTGQDQIDLPFINLVIAKHVSPNTDIDDIPNRVYVRLMMFSQIICQTVKAEGLNVPSVYASDEALTAFYDELFNRPEHRGLLQAWIDALQRVNRAPNEGKKKTEMLDDSSSNA